eukprot:430247-Prymnesium_polylepis.1
MRILSAWRVSFAVAGMMDDTSFSFAGGQGLKHNARGSGTVGERVVLKPPQWGTYRPGWPRGRRASAHTPCVA